MQAQFPHLICAAPVPKQALKQKGYRGPNGASVLAYEWRSMLAEDYSKYEDGLVGKRVSDWENALPCESCGRKIVHVWWVKQVDGNVRPYGGDHLHLPLGYDRELSKGKLTHLRRKVLEVEDKRKQQAEIAKMYEGSVKRLAVPLSFGQGVIREAIRKYMESGNRASPPPVFLLNKGAGLVMRADAFHQGFLKAMKGWEKVDPKVVKDMATGAVTAARSTEAAAPRVDLDAISAALRQAQRDMRDDDVAVKRRAYETLATTVRPLGQYADRLEAMKLQRADQQRKVKTVLGPLRRIRRMAADQYLDTVPIGGAPLTSYMIKGTFDSLSDAIKIVVKYWDRITQYLSVERTFQHGPFTIDNHYGAAPNEYADVLAVLDDASARLQAKGFKALLYGKVVLRGKAGSHSGAASYNYRRDIIKIDLDSDHSFGAVNSLVHEFGHRYWFTRMSDAERDAYEDAWSSSAKVSLSLAERLGFWSAWKGSGFDLRKAARAVKAEQRERFVDYVKERRKHAIIVPGKVSVEMAERQFVMPKTRYYYLAGQPASVTRYGSSSVVEDFAEVFAAYVMGRRLPEDVDRRFKLARKRAGASVVTAAYSTALARSTDKIRALLPAIETAAMRVRQILNKYEETGEVNERSLKLALTKHRKAVEELGKLKAPRDLRPGEKLWWEVCHNTIQNLVIKRVTDNTKTLAKDLKALSGGQAKKRWEFRIDDVVKDLEERAIPEFTRRDFLEREFKYGDFTIVDEYGMIARSVEPWFEVITRASKVLKSKGFGYLLYGVLKLDQGSWAGLYRATGDTVHLSVPSGGREPAKITWMISVLVHELGHRLWFKFLDGGARDKFSGPWIDREEAARQAWESFQEVFTFPAGEAEELFELMWRTKYDIKAFERWANKDKGRRLRWLQRLRSVYPDASTTFVENGRINPKAFEAARNRIEGFEQGAADPTQDQNYRESKQESLERYRKRQKRVWTEPDKYAMQITQDDILNMLEPRGAEYNIKSPRSEVEEAVRDALNIKPIEVSVSPYGNTNRREDFAETFMAVVLGQQKDRRVAVRLQSVLPRGRVLSKVIAATDIADRTTVNLQSEYDKLNRKVWGGELPRVPLKWTRSKTTGGRVITRGLRNDPASWVIKILEVSDFTESTYEEFLGILAHEMCHVYVMSNGIQEPEHGTEFLGQRKHAQRVLGIDIPLTENITSKRVSKNVKVQPVGVVVFTRNNGVQVYKESVMPAVLRYYAGAPEGWKQRNPVEFYLVTDRDMAKFPIRRKPPGKSLTYHMDIPAELITRIRGGKRLSTATVTAGLGSDLHKKMKALLADFDPDQAKKIAEWLAANFAVEVTRTPRGHKAVKAKAEHMLWELRSRWSSMQDKDQAVKQIAHVWSEFAPMVPALIKHFSKEGGADIPRELKVGANVYKNPVGMTAKKLKTFADAMEKIWGDLKGWRKKALAGGLTVVVSGPKGFRGTATGVYRSAQDELWVRATPKVLKRSGGSYAAPDYILVHELGHRYERKARVPVDFDRQSWWTTPYSRKEGEGFAELFALGHFRITTHGATKFPEIIDRFETVMMGGLTSSLTGDKPRVMSATKLNPPYMDPKRLKWIGLLEAAHEKGEIYNVDYKDAKFALGNALERASDEHVKATEGGGVFYYLSGFLRFGSIKKHLREAEKWLRNPVEPKGYRLDGMWGDPAGAKEIAAVKSRVQFLKGWLELHELIEGLKSKVVKGRKPSRKPVKPVYKPPFQAMKALAKIGEMLAALIESKRKELEGVIEDRLRREVEAFLKAHEAHLEKTAKEGKNYDPYSPDRWSHFADPIVRQVVRNAPHPDPKYKHIGKDDGRSPEWWWKVELRKDADKLIKDRASRDAAAVAEQFVAKNTGKITSIVGEKSKRAEMSVAKEVSTRFDSGAFEGTLRFEFKDGTRFDVRNQVVFKQSQYRRSFVQFPTTFHQVVWPGGKKTAKRSEKQMNEEWAVAESVTASTDRDLDVTKTVEVTAVPRGLVVPTRSTPGAPVVSVLKDGSTLVESGAEQLRESLRTGTPLVMTVVYRGHSEGLPGVWQVKG